MFRYRIYGLLVETEHGLESHAEAMSGDAPVDLVILRAGDTEFLAARLIAESETWHDGYLRHVDLPDGGLYVAWKDWLELLVDTSGTSLRFAARPEAPPESLAAYLVIFGVCLSLMLQGEETLHATIVSQGGKGLGLIGPSGTGKSTLAAQLIRRGARLVTDDVARFDFSGSEARVYPGSCYLKLYGDSAKAVLPASENAGLFDPDEDKSLIEIPDRPFNNELTRLERLVFLSPDDEAVNREAIILSEVTGLERFELLTGSTMNSKFTRPWRLRQQMQFVQSVSSKVPFFKLRYPRTYGRLDEVVRVVSG